MGENLGDPGLMRASSRRFAKATKARHADGALLKAIATAHVLWAELLANPTWRTQDLATHHSVSKSWATRILRLPILDPKIVERTVAGIAPASLTFDALEGQDDIPALWAHQRARHRMVG